MRSDFDRENEDLLFPNDEDGDELADYITDDHDDDCNCDTDEDKP